MTSLFECECYAATQKENSLKSQAMFKKMLILLIWLAYPFAIYAQVGGQASFTALRLPVDARTVGLGGTNISAQQQDVNRFIANPALLNDSVQGHASVSYMRWQASTDLFQLNYAPRLPKVGLIGIGLQVLNYGKMPLTLPNGIQQGTFTANDITIGITKNFKKRYFTYGATLKYVGSQIATYNAVGVAFDVGGTFQHPKHDFLIALTVKNIGFTVNNYTNTRLNLPFDILLGTTIKPKYMPLRFSITLQHLYRWDIVYLDSLKSNQLDANGNIVPLKKTAGDKFLRHLVLGSELILSKSLQILVGYNHLQAREMRLDDVGGLRGFSFGLRFQTAKWQCSFARGLYAVGSGRNMLTINGNLNKMIRKKSL